MGWEQWLLASLLVLGLLNSYANDGVMKKITFRDNAITMAFFVLLLQIGGFWG